MSIRRMSDFVRSQSPVTLPSGTSVKKACQAMRDHHVGAILVTDEHGGLTGIFTGRDAVSRVLAEGRNVVQTKLSEVMSPKPRTMAPGATAIDALHHAGRSLPPRPGGRWWAHLRYRLAWRLPRP
jgi:CBS domain-containing protein